MRVYVLLVAMMISFDANAGFWSSVAGGVVANSITGQSRSVNNEERRKIDAAQTKEIKIQEALYGLGFFGGNFDGNLNTLKSRKAINSFQKTYKIRATGILSANNKQHLLYIHELYVALGDIIKNKPIDKDKRNIIYNEIDNAVALINRRE